VQHHGNAGRWHPPIDLHATLPLALVAADACQHHSSRRSRALVFAADYPFLDVLWTMIIFFCWVVWIWMMILIISDVFRRDISGWAKAAWIVFLIVLPFLGALIYLIANGSEMAQRRVRDAQVSQDHFDTYVRSVATSGGSAAEIESAKRLLDAGTITQEEFDALKAKALA
jgi:general stress protein CsbA